MEKPDTEIYLHTLKVLQVQPNEAVFIDDNEGNIDGAKNVGLQTILFVSATQLKNDLYERGVLM